MRKPCDYTREFQTLQAPISENCPIIWTPYGRSGGIPVVPQELDAWNQAFSEETQKRQTYRRSDPLKIQEIGITEKQFDDLWMLLVPRSTPYATKPIARGLPSPVDNWSIAKVKKRDDNEFNGSLKSSDLLFHLLDEKHWVGSNRVFRRSGRNMTQQLIVDIDNHVPPYFWPDICWERLPLRFQQQLARWQMMGIIPKYIDLCQAVRLGFLEPFDGYKTYQQAVIEPYQRLRQVIPAAPTAVFRSTNSGGVHVYWLFSEPVELDTLLAWTKSILRECGLADLEVFPIAERPLRVPFGAQSRLLDPDTLQPLNISKPEQIERFLSGYRYDSIGSVLGSIPSRSNEDGSHRIACRINVHERNDNIRYRCVEDTDDARVVENSTTKIRHLVETGMMPGNNRFDVAMKVGWRIFLDQISPNTPWNEVEDQLGQMLFRWFQENHNGQSNAITEDPIRVMKDCRCVAQKIVEHARANGQRPGLGRNVFLTENDLSVIVTEVEREFSSASTHDRRQAFYFLLDFLRFARRHQQNGQPIQIPKKQWLNFMGVTKRGSDAATYYSNRQTWLEKLGWLVRPLRRSYSNYDSNRFSLQFYLRIPESEGDPMEDVNQAIGKLLRVEQRIRLFGSKPWSFAAFSKKQKSGKKSSKRR